MVQLLMQMGREQEVGAVARLVLSQKECIDAEEIEAILALIESTPAGWSESIERFAEKPSEEHWSAIVRFAPEERIYDWTRKAWRDLRRKNCDPNAMIRFATQTGITPDAMELVEEGGVSPETLIERGSQKGAAKSFWLGLAAQAAYLQGEKFRAVSLLREAVGAESDFSTPMGSIWFLREQEDPELEAMMKSAGVWEVER